MTRRDHKRYSGERRTGKGKGILFLSGLLLGMILITGLYLTSEYFSTDQSCLICHVHPHVENTWKLSKHVNNRSGTRVHCIDCHLPPRHDTWAHYTAKARLGLKDLWGLVVKDSAGYDWERMSELEHAVTYIPNQSCKECHQNLFPQGVTDDAITAHLYYEENEERLNLQCISCHLDAGHYNPSYTHGKMTGIPGLNASGRTADTSLFFKTPAEVTSFASYEEHIPGTAVTINMIAVPGGSFPMGSPEKESFHKPDESPVRTVTLSPFFMAEVETTWNQYWAFYANTMSEGRTPPETVYLNNSNPAVDAISGPTPPFGLPDQGWGMDDRPAITMTHYAAETFCLWLSKKTGRRYRLPTEAEWEYAARGGTEAPYFFSGDPARYSAQGFIRKFIDARTDTIGSYVIYAANSKNRTQEPSLVKANPWGLKNMLGNVMEYCADRYAAQAYSETGVKDPVATDGDEWVVRGGNYTSDAADVRAAARDYTRHESWMRTDPQQPKSIWWYSDFRGIGFRVVCEADSSMFVKE
jgi:formylglycine-generating enzyme required for sulfatase activity/nitrate/TMAO reductase-like tetraheme cytochrome c subunit